MPIKSLLITYPVDPELQRRAEEMRKNMTPAEARLWRYLKADRLEGFHFRRQQVIARYIVDFFCYQADLVVEVDGGIHLEQEEYDQERDLFLESLGLSVMRFTNRDVYGNLEDVLGMILEACRRANPQPSGQEPAE